MSKKTSKKLLSASCKNFNEKKRKFEKPIYNFNELLLCNNDDKFVNSCKNSTINQIDILACSIVVYQKS